MTDGCPRWIALADREALGETLTIAESTFAREHVVSCAECRAEAELFAGMRSLVDEPAADRETADGERRSRMAKSARKDAPDGTRSSPLRQRRGRVVVLAAVCVAAAAAALVVARGALAPKERSNLVESKAPPLPVPSLPEARVVLSVVSGGLVEVDGRASSVGQEVAKASVLFARDGSACLEIDSLVRACMSQGSLLRIAETRGATRFELLGGEISADLDPLPAGTSFGITTRDGSAIAVGTAFSVEVPGGDAPVVTRVAHGTVVVRALGGAERRVHAHEMSSMSAAVGSPPIALPSADEDRIRALMLATPRAAGQSLAPVRFESAAPGSIVTVDEHVVGRSPVALLLPPGDHVVAVGAPAHGTVRETVRVGVSEPVAHRFELPAAAPARNVAPPKGSADLLSLARERGAHGDLDGSVAAYRELFDRYGTTVEAHSALVPFGELQMGRLSDARGALASFDRYLVDGGSLEEEASFGRIRALRALGRSGEERLAIEAFLRRFPDGPLATSLRERLRSLGDR